MNRYQQKAWTILSEDERMAVTLQLGHSKSTWQAGEIMGKAHYKYIEIQERAQFFFRMFTDHFKIYNNKLFPKKCKLSKPLKKYFRLLILGRLKSKAALDALDSPEIPTLKKRNEMIKAQLNWLSESNSSVDLNILAMIKDYDRWNNFRILPPECQESSAFKRRNKNRNKRDIKNFIEIEPFSADLIFNRYHTEEEGPKNFYVPIFFKKQEIVEIVPINRDQKIIEKISTAGLYIFNRQIDAQEFANLALEYYFDEENNCKKGLIFWPKFRKLVNIAVNYEIIQNIVNSRKHIRYNLDNL